MDISPKIILDCDKMKKPNTGLFSFCLYLTTALVKVATEEDEYLSVFAPQSVLDRNLFDKNITYVRRRLWNKYYLNLPGDYKVWHSTFQLGLYWPKNVQSNVLTIHDLNFLYHRREKDYEFCMKNIKRNIERADRIVAISEFTKSDILSHLDLNGKEVEVIHNGCHKYDGPVIEPLNKPTRPFIFSLGTILPKKNFHVLPCLLKDNDLDLIIAGNISSYSLQIMKEAHKWGVSDRVKIIGPVDESNKQWYLKNCYAFVFPSIAEGFGLPVVEAMNYGVPVFLSRHTSLPEVGGETAIYFNREFDPEMMQFEFLLGINNYNSDSKVKEKIKERAGMFSWSTAAKQYWDIYKEIT